jgi:hypothetical protein
MKYEITDKIYDSMTSSEKAILNMIYYDAGLYQYELEKSATDIFRFICIFWLVFIFIIKMFFGHIDEIYGYTLIILLVIYSPIEEQYIKFKVRQRESHEIYEAFGNKFWTKD